MTIGILQIGQNLENIFSTAIKISEEMLKRVVFCKNIGLMILWANSSIGNKRPPQPTKRFFRKR